MFKKVLIANRGEIALRIVRACRELGIRTVAIYSESDVDSLPVRMADEAVCVGPAAPALSYLNIPHILSAAEITHADAIHPGYGFLAEDAHFSEVCGSAGLNFIGPTPEVLRQVGDKFEARRVMARRGIPVIPGGGGEGVDLVKAQEIAIEIGYPVILKAASGGGGRGIRVVYQPEDFVLAYQAAQREAQGSENTLYIEKYLADARHIEVQILADRMGHMIHVGERECSIQRRHQKLVEETPSPAVGTKLRQRLGRAALKAAQAVHYTHAGTVEFLLDHNQKFYFIEMNARIQVEHPITEMVSGIDLVKTQIEIAAGKPLAWTQRQVKLRGHSIECRINAEDPDRWIPTPGCIQTLHFPGGPGVRVDSAATAGCVISPEYDSLVAKLIVHAESRLDAIARMKGALSECRIEGIKTPIPLYQRIFSDPDFIKGEISTRFIERFSPSFVPTEEASA